MENQVKNQKQKKKIITKAICVIIAILLMVGIAFTNTEIVKQRL